jgi:transcriptional regulator with XRE-family HTH domain
LGTENNRFNQEKLVMANKKPPNPIDARVGSRVREARNILGMSQEKLGAALGLTFQQIQKYEKGANRIGASRLQQISQTVGKPISWFYEGLPSQGTIMPDDPAQILATTREGMELARGFIKIKDSATRHAVVVLVGLIASEADAKRKAA